MKTKIRRLLPVLALLATGSVVLAAAEKATSKESKSEMRVIAGPDRDRRIFVHRDAEKGEKEIVTFLGVEAAPVAATTSVQLSLPRGTGLVVQHVVPKSPAAGVLNEHDILLKLDDQILIETRQLSVLIRNHKKGDEVVLTYMRGGQQHTAKVTLGEQEVPKFSSMFGAGPRAFAFGSDGGASFGRWVPGTEGEREDVDCVLSLIRRAPVGTGVPKGPNPPPVRIQIDRRDGPGFRAMRVNTGNSNLVFSDDSGSLELSFKDGAKTLVAKNSQGEQIFSGPVTTPEERKAMPGDVRVRLEKLEEMHDVTFHTDGDFKGAETRTVRPRGIAMPWTPKQPLSLPPPPFF